MDLYPGVGIEWTENQKWAQKLEQKKKMKWCAASFEKKGFWPI